MEKWAFDSKNTILAIFFGVKWLFFHQRRPFIFSEDVKNHVKKLMRGRKVGVTHEKTGI